jgi:hypothetical protein
VGLGKGNGAITRCPTIDTSGVSAVKAWESKGLKIHTWTINKRPIRGVIVSEFWAWFDAHEVRHDVLSEN